ncbi:MAG: hypothetical protein WCD46_17375, partial [Desulfobacterales bacterium]
LVTAVAELLAAVRAAGSQAAADVNVLRDAERIVYLGEQQKTAPRPVADLQQALAGELLTECGRQTAAAVLLKP